MPRAPLGLLLLVASCVAAPPREAQKPHAPVELTGSAREVAPGLYEVTVRARALVDLDALSVELLPSEGVSHAGGERGFAGVPLAGGVRRSFVARVRADGPRELIVAARTPWGGRAVGVPLGTLPAAKAAPASRVVITPFDPAAEVMP